MLIRSMRNCLVDSPPRTSLRWFDPPLPNFVCGRVKSRVGNRHFTRLAKRLSGFQGVAFVEFFALCWSLSRRNRLRARVIRPVSALTRASPRP